MPTTVQNILILVLCCINAINSYPQADKITHLPGLTFQPGFDQYSGYLNASTNQYQHYLFYWLVMSQTDPENDPILLWMNGGPGCSSLGGLFTEIGPFHPNKNGTTLYENVFTWNKQANVLFMEAPTGVGFSYSTDQNDITNDDQTADDNYRALQDFFTKKFPEFQRRDFYITGESYCGVYIPTLTQRFIDNMDTEAIKNEFPNNLKGIAIGNGMLSARQQHNSIIMFMYYHGLIGKRLYDNLNTACCGSPAVTCNWYNHLIQLNNNWKSDGSLCSNLTYEISEQQMRHSENNEYNIYQDCYRDSNDHSISDLNQMIKQLRINANGNENNALQINYESTDSLNGFPCWANNATTKYLNDRLVKQALHINPLIIDREWIKCNFTIKEKLYQRIYYEMDDVFKYILENSDIRILIYNGDVDMVCNFLGDQWFIFNVAAANNLQFIGERDPWWYRSQIAGYVQKLDRIDLVTVKGAGHYVPRSRSGPALQLIMNFIRNKNYSAPVGIKTKFTSLASNSANDMIAFAFMTISICAMILIEF